MSNSVLNVNVAVTPKGESVDDGVKFTYSPGPDTPNGCVTRKGDINLNKLSRAGICDIGFTLTTPTISWKKGPSIGTFDMSFFGAANGGKDAIWISPEGKKPKGPYAGSEFTGFDLGPGNGTLTVQDRNDDRKSYDYALAVRAATDGSLGKTFRDDPRIMNRTV